MQITYATIHNADPQIALEARTSCCVYTDISTQTRQDQVPYPLVFDIGFEFGDHKRVEHGFTKYALNVALRWSKDLLCTGGARNADIRLVEGTVVSYSHLALMLRRSAVTKEADMNDLYILVPKRMRRLIWQLWKCACLAEMCEQTSNVSCDGFPERRGIVNSRCEVALEVNDQESAFETKGRKV